MAPPHDHRALELGRRNAERVVPRYRSMVLHWLRRSLGRAAPVARSPLPPVEPGQVAITWGGHATALVRYAGLTMLCDPMLGRSCAGVPREVAPGLDDAALADVDLVLVSHDSPAHLHVPTLARLPRRATVVVPQRAGPRVSPLGFARLVELAQGESFEHRGVFVEAQPVRHGDRDRPAQAYVLRGDGPSVYFCGASGYFTGFADTGRRHRPDLALLPIAGYWPASFRERYMSPLDALYAFEDLGARLMVPISYGTFALSYEQVHDPERWLADLIARRRLHPYVTIVPPGESRVFVAAEAVGVDVDFDAAEPGRSGSGPSAGARGAGETGALGGAGQGPGSVAAPARHASMARWRALVLPAQREPRGDRLDQGNRAPRA